MFSTLAALALLVLPADVLVTRSDGSELRGEWKAKTVELSADFGRIEFDLERVGRIELGAVDRVILADGRSFEGELDLARMRLETGDGKQTLRASDLTTIEFLVGGRAVLSTDFSGRWCTSFGPMTLEQRGTQVTGSYGFNDEFSISGTAEGGSLSFVAQEANGSSVGTWELWEDADTFSGQFRFDGGNERFWGGYRIEPLVPEPVPGEVVSGQTGSWLNYHLRVPSAWDAERDWPAIAFFHGSNMSSRAYVDTIVATWPELAQEFVLVGIDGEKLSSRSKPGGERFFNFSYINFSGHEVGQTWRYRQSPGLVADALDELGAVLPISKWLLGGHSQGGFLTYAMVMYYPDKIAGAFPMSCNLLVQCEPDAFDGEARRRAQRAVALAPIHGRRDGVVEFSSGAYCYERMQDGGFPTLRFFAPEGVGHEFAWLPVEQAVRWLDGMTSGDAFELLELAQTELAAGRYRSATAAAKRAADAGATEAAVAGLTEAVDAAAADRAQELARAIEADADASWVAGFWGFREEFAFTPAAEPVMAAYARVRKAHREGADKAFYAARGESDAEVRQERYREILERWYGSKWYPMVSRWLEEK